MVVHPLLHSVDAGSAACVGIQVAGIIARGFPAFCYPLQAVCMGCAVAGSACPLHMDEVADMDLAPKQAGCTLLQRSTGS